MITDIDELRWQAVRNRSAGQSFLYAVETTGIFCRPGCSSRLPNPRNVRFFATVQEARRAGFRPCKRCRPEAAPGPPEAIVAACRRIEAADEAPDLEALANEAGLSAFHFQRLFKQVTGVTPKQYAVAVRRRRFQESLDKSKTVTDAIYAAGYGSAGRAYQAGALGMPPSTYRAGAPGAEIRFAVAETTLGPLVVAATPRGVCMVAFGESPSALATLVQTTFPAAAASEEDPQLTEWLAILVDSIEQPGAAHPKLPLDIRGTAFQQRVWQALREIPPGATCSYAELAGKIGAPTATRAVARACATNPVAVTVPCHRVIGSDGQLRGYRWGVERKRELLAREAGVTAAPSPADPPAMRRSR